MYFTAVYYLLTSILILMTTKVNNITTIHPEFYCDRLIPLQRTLRIHVWLSVFCEIISSSRFHQFLAGIGHCRLIESTNLKVKSYSPLTPLI